MIGTVWMEMCRGLLHLVYPRVCIGCGSDLVEEGQLLCLECLASLPLTQFHLHANNPVEKIFAGRLRLSCACSYLYFTKQSLVQHALHQLKYKGNRAVGQFFGRRMGMALREAQAYDDVDGLVPLPLFFTRERARGYNQSQLICEGMSEIMNVPVMNKVIRRTEYTETQTKKGRKERWENIKGKFELIDEEAISGKHVLLVDDVLTTGATLEACGSELAKAKDMRLGIVTLAYTST